MGCKNCINESSIGNMYIGNKNDDNKKRDNLIIIDPPKKTIFNFQQVNSFCIISQKKKKVIKPKVTNERILKIPKDVQNYIYKQKEKCVCKIKINNSVGTGFFCNIPFPNDSNFLPVLITNNHVLGLNDITPDSCINISIDDENYNSKIIVGNNRLTYTDPFYDVTILELKKDDGLKINGLEVDYEEYEAPLEEFQKLQIYLIHYPKSKRVCKSVGEIKDISENDLTIRHTCSTAGGSSGCPIINLNNLKVIGVHKGSLDNQNFNVGTFIKGPIEKFNEIHKKFTQKLNPGRFSFLKYIEYKDINMNMEESEQKKKHAIKNDICIIFASVDQKIFVCIPCSSEYSIFADVEKKIYKIYPEYKDLETYFLCNGVVIRRFQTIKENKIKDNNSVLICIHE